MFAFAQSKEKKSPRNDGTARKVFLVSISNAHENTATKGFSGRRSNRGWQRAAGVPSHDTPAGQIYGTVTAIDSGATFRQHRAYSWARRCPCHGDVIRGELISRARGAKFGLECSGKTASKKTEHFIVPEGR